MSTTLTYDTFTKKAEEVKQYDDWVPEILANDQAKLKIVGDKVLPFVFQEALQRVLLSKDVNGKNRERFLDLLVLNYARLGKKSLGEAQETFMIQVRDIKNGLADVVKAIPSSDSTTALRVDIASKNADLMNVALKALNQAAIQKDLDARLALKAPADTTVVSRPVLIAHSIANAYDDAVAAKAIDAAAAGTEKALVLPAGTIGSDFVIATAASDVGPATATVTVASPAAPAATAAPAAGSTTSTPTTTAAGTAASATKAGGVIGDAVSTTTPSSTATSAPVGGTPAPSLPASSGPTAAYTPPGQDDATKKNAPVTSPSATSVTPPSTESSGLSTQAIIGIAVGVLALIAAIVTIIMANRKSPEDVAAEETKEAIEGAPLLPVDQTTVINA